MGQRPRLSALFFDVDDTVYSSTEFAGRARRAAIEAMLRTGLKGTPEAVLAELDRVVAEFTSNYEHHFDALLKRLGPASHPGVNPALIVAAGVIAYHQTKARDLIPYPDALDVLEALAETTRLRLGVVTDGRAVKQAEKLLRLGFTRFIDPGAVFISEQLGLSKENPDFYRRLLAETGLPAGEVLCVGDHPVRDIDSANAAGLVTVLQRRGGKYGELAGKTAPRYVVGDFYELYQLVTREFELPPREAGSLKLRAARPSWPGQNGPSGSK